MNSLNILSRHLENSTSHERLPQQERPQPGSSKLRRSETWSKPLHFRRRSKKPLIILRDSSGDSSEDSADHRLTIVSRPTHRRAKRSFSSPALLKGTSATQYPDSTSSNCPVTPSEVSSKPQTACSKPAAPSDKELLHKESYLYRKLKRLSLIKTLILIWDAIYNTYEQFSLTQQSKSEVVSTDKDTEDEALAMSLVSQASVDGADSEGKRETDYLSIQSTTRHSVKESSPSHIPTPPRTTLISRRPNPFQKTKTLVLDLDETLIHSTIRPMRGSRGFFGFEFGGKRIGKGHIVEVVLNGRSTKYHVYKRPFVDYFLRKVSGWYTIVIFTASMREYADPVIDWLDAGRGVLQHRLFRDSCTPLPSGSYTKDLSLVEDDLSRVCLVDNSPVCYSVNPSNAIPIEGWTHDLSDEALLDLLPILDSLRFTNDVRRVLGLRGYT